MHKTKKQQKQKPVPAQQRVPNGVD
jgi:hypothetical protein